ncbi:MAG TPA: dihydrolipoamide acetyltransferase family protein [Gemmatimonadales bacterium]|nr:dihydrolipoamide acetyltransferase family protein [Gemmatimonadales bacterium]
MATKVVMEALSPTMEEGRLVEWKKREGEAVAVGDVLAEVETDKAVMELVARAGGTLLKQVVPAGTTVPVSELVALIGEPGEAVDNGKPAPSAAPKPAGPVGAAGAEQATQPTPGRNQPGSMPPAPPARAANEAAPPAPPRAAPPPTAPQAAPAPAAAGGRLRASPLARRIAAERGIDLNAVAGSGPEGRIVLRDLEGAPAAATRGAPARAAPLAPGAAAPAPAAPLVPRFVVPQADGAPFSDVPLTQLRKTIARRLVQSIGPIPTFYLTTEVDMERAWDAREALKALGEGPKVSFNDIIIKAVATALRQHPACNAWWQDDHIRYWHEIHVSMAVAIEDGLITPVIHHADHKSLRQISAEAHDLATRARERRLAPEEYTGGTFSVSNLGMLDIDEFTAVINPPEAGILAVGRIVEKPVAHEGQVAVRRRLRLTMSCDHRVIDGATGAQFLKTLKAMLENPLAMVW